MRIIMGLGNPGESYEATRHNLGFMVVDELCRAWAGRLDAVDPRARLGLARVAGKQVLLVKPMTFMNHSGHALAPALERMKAKPERILVICDEMNLPLGRLRLRRRGSHGGHNGLASVEAALGTVEYPRLRVGIDRGRRGDEVGHVLGRFTPEEVPLVREMAAMSADLIRDVLVRGIEYCMNRYNSMDMRTTRRGDDDQA